MGIRKFMVAATLAATACAAASCTAAEGGSGATAPKAPPSKAQPPKARPAPPVLDECGLLSAGGLTRSTRAERGIRLVDRSAWRSGSGWDITCTYGERVEAEVGTDQRDSSIRIVTGDRARSELTRDDDWSDPAQVPDAELTAVKGMEGRVYVQSLYATTVIDDDREVPVHQATQARILQGDRLIVVTLGVEENLGAKPRVHDFEPVLDLAGRAHTAFPARFRIEPFQASGACERVDRGRVARLLGRAVVASRSVVRADVTGCRFASTKRSLGVDIITGRTAKGGYFPADGTPIEVGDKAVYSPYSTVVRAGAAYIRIGVVSTDPEEILPDGKKTPTPIQLDFYRHVVTAVVGG